MIKFPFSVFVLLIFATNSYGQPQTFGSFVPADFSILDSASGDINKDGKKDVLVILKNNQEENNGDTVRPLLVLLGDGNDLYELGARNDSVVLCRACGGVFGDPYAGITVKNNFFRLSIMVAATGDGPVSLPFVTMRKPAKFIFTVMPVNPFT